MLGVNKDLKSQQWIVGVFLGCLMSQVSCRQTSTDPCNWTDTQGLVTDGWDGSDLPDKQISLIFLKGPSEHTQTVAAALDRYDVQGAFFVRGSEVENYQSELEALSKSDKAHLIGNGGYRFQNLRDAKEPVLELRTTDALITPFVEDNKYLFYAPQKVFDQDLARQLKLNGFAKYVGPIRDDTVPSRTFKYDEQCWDEELSASACALLYQEEIQRLGKGIVALHDTDKRTAEMLDLLIPNLQSAGYTFARVDKVPSIAAALPDGQGGTVQSCDDYH